MRLPGGAVVARRAALVWAAALAARPLGAPAVSIRELQQDESPLTKLLDGSDLRVNAAAPRWDEPAACLNGPAARVAPSSWSRDGRYVVLWVFPEAGLPGTGANNALEAANFEKLRDEFAALDAVCVGVSSQSGAAAARLAASAGLTSPLLYGDAGLALAEAFGAASRQSFIVDASGRVRWIERNVEGIGAFSLENHAARVQRELYQVRNADGWAV